MKESHASNHVPAFLNKYKYGGYQVRNGNTQRLNSPRKFIVLRKPVYEDYNPYSLNHHRNSKPALYRDSTAPGLLTPIRDNAQESSSEKSIKIVRKNVLKKAQKPNLASQRNTNRLQTSTPGGKSKTDDLSKPNSVDQQQQGNHRPPNKMGSSNSLLQLHQISKSFSLKQDSSMKEFNDSKHDRNVREEYQKLRDQNRNLKQSLKRTQQIYSQEIICLNEHVRNLYQITAQLEKDMVDSQEQWRAFLSRRTQIHG